MCVPLLERGNMLGVIYVGNDNVAQLFEESHLEVLTIFASQASLLIRNALLVNELQLDNRSLQERIERIRFGEILGSSPPMQEVFRKVQKVAATDISVLITGETGTGKELIARELHNRSPRAKGPFVTINCGAIPENLLESRAVRPRARRLHRRGRQQGRAGSRPPIAARCSSTRSARCRWRLQVKILRALQERVVVRVGDTNAEAVDIRVLAATNRDLETEIKAGPLPRGSLLPPERRAPAPAAAARSRRRHRGARALHGRPLRARVRRQGAGADAATRSPPSSVTAGRATSASSRTASRRRSCCPTRRCSAPEDLDLTADDLPPILPLADAKEKFQREYINEILRSTTATAPRPRATWASIRARSSATSRKRTAASCVPRTRESPKCHDPGARNDCTGADSNVLVAGAPMGEAQRDPAPLHPGTTRA